MGWLMGRLREVGADKQVAALAQRLPAAAHFEFFVTIGDHEVRFRFGREPDSSPADPWSWEDLE
ncbi:hypothetical protein [Frankia gtarii]|uniref:hypothetical protein n=1 Tax=Frankia gtarii TaxID=2950102 RepID=UPI0021BF37E5|nr:hypothetical protein [Frankia gtarii]